MATAEATTTSRAQPASSLNLLQSETWTQEAPPPAVTNSLYISRACAHKGRLVVFLSDGTACERADDGSWYPYEVARGCGHNDLVESVILG